LIANSYNDPKVIGVNNLKIEFLFKPSKRPDYILQKIFTFVFVKGLRPSSLITKINDFTKRLEKGKKQKKKCEKLIKFPDDGFRNTSQ